MISRSFLKSSLVYTVAGTLPMASAIILLPFYIQHLSTELYGALTVYLVFSMFVQILVTFSFDSSVYIHFHELKSTPEKLSVFIVSVFLFMILLGIVVGLVLTATGDILFRWVLPDKNISFYPYGLVGVGSGIVQAISKVHSMLLQSREKPMIFFWSNVLMFTMIAGFTIGGLYLFPNSLVGPVIGRFLASTITALWALRRIFSEFGWRYDFQWLRSSFSFNSYTFIYQLEQWVINYFDRILMLFFLTLDHVGVYDFAVKCLIPIELLMGSLQSSFYPKVVSAIMGQSSKASTPEINRYYHGLTATMMLLVAGSILFYPWLIETFVTKPAYQEALKYIPYIAVLYIFRTMRLFFATPYGILKYTKPLPFIYLFVSALKIALIVLMIQSYQVYGVIIASLITAISEIFLLKHYVRHKFEFRFNTFKIIFAPLFLFLMIIILEPLAGSTMPLTIHLIYFVSCAGLLFWAYRNEIQLMNPFGKR